MSILKVDYGDIGGGIEFTDGGRDLTSITFNEDHKYAYVSVYRASAITATLNGVSISPTYTDTSGSQRLYIYIIPNIKANDILTCSYGLGYLTFID